MPRGRATSELSLRSVSTRRRAGSPSLRFTIFLVTLQRDLFNMIRVMIARVSRHETTLSCLQNNSECLLDSHKSFN